MDIKNYRVWRGCSKSEPLTLISTTGSIYLNFRMSSPHSSLDDKCIIRKMFREHSNFATRATLRNEGNLKGTRRGHRYQHVKWKAQKLASFPYFRNTADGSSAASFAVQMDWIKQLPPRTCSSRFCGSNEIRFAEACVVSPNLKSFM